MKKLVKLFSTALCIAALCAGTFVYSKAIAADKSTLKVALTSKPTQISCGSSFNIKGTAISNYTINSIAGYIFKSGNTSSIQHYVYNPRVRYLDIQSSPVNTQLKFSKLATGSYIMMFSAKDTSGKTFTTSAVRFNVISLNNKVASKLKITLTDKPSTINEGASFDIGGTITSNYKINKAVGYIFKEGNPTNIQNSGYYNPNSTSVNIGKSQINSKLAFGSLAAGNYKLYIAATDTSGKSVNTGMIKFTVVKPVSTVSDSTIKINLTAYPKKIVQFNSFDVKGMITSTNTLTNVSAFIFKKGEKHNTLNSGLYNPNAKTVNIETSNVNKRLLFGNLMPGEYTFCISATDEKGITETTKMYPFTVTERLYTYNVDDEGIEFIKLYEGFVKYPYWDYSQYSVGYGCHCESWEYTNGITEEQADILLRKYLKREYEPKLNDFLVDNGIKVTQSQYNALLSFTFNLGAYCWTRSTGFEEIKEMMLIGPKFYTDSEIRDVFCLYCYAGGAKNQGLLNRRTAEANMFIKGTVR